MVGARLYYDYNPFSQQGGLRQYPLSGVFSGVEVTLKNSGKGFDSTDTSKIHMDVAGGEIILDSQRFTFSDLSDIKIETGTDLSSTEKTLDVYLIPTRMVPVVLQGNSAPATPSMGDMYIEAAKLGTKKPQMPYYHLATDIFKYDGSNWISVKDEVRKIPWNDGNQNGYSLNQVKEEVTADNFALENELDVFMDVESMPYHTKPVNPSQREPGGFRIATIYYPGDGSQANIQQGISKYDYIRI